jgi:hypothetical protein
MGNERARWGRNDSGGEGGSGGVLWIAGRDLEEIILCNAKNLRRRIPAPFCQTLLSLPVSDVKIKILVFLCHVREYLGNPDLQQNADTGIFLLGDFLRVLALREIHVLREDRPLY